MNEEAKDWSARQVRLRAELLAISVVLFFYAFFSKSLKIDALFTGVETFKDVEFPHETMFWLTASAWVYVAFHLWQRTNIERSSIFSQMGNLKKDALEVNGISKSISRRYDQFHDVTLSNDLNAILDKIINSKSDIDHMNNAVIEDEAKIVISDINAIYREHTGHDLSERSRVFENEVIGFLIRLGYHQLQEIRIQIDQAAKRLDFSRDKLITIIETIPNFEKEATNQVERSERALKSIERKTLSVFNAFSQEREWLSFRIPFLLCFAMWHASWVKVYFFK